MPVVCRAAAPTTSAIVARDDNADRIKSALSAQNTSQLAWINCQLRVKREIPLDIAIESLPSPTVT